MNPRGVTLVELLAAISIMVIVTALSLPAVQSRLVGAKVEAAQGQVEAAVIATRAEAVRTGKVLELFAREGRDGVELAVRKREREEIQAGRDKGGSKGSMLCVLPVGMKVSEGPRSLETTEGAGRRRVESGKSSITDEKVGAEVRVALFCPDGMSVSSPVYLNDGSVDWEISVNSWVGGAGFSVFAPEDEDGQPVDEAPKEGKPGEAR
jgi:prepilin-type N-terminal cleavage/methylation domain-containing protein